VIEKQDNPAPRVVAFLPDGLSAADAAETQANVSDAKATMK
jgi:hypothetical protein